MVAQLSVVMGNPTEQMDSTNVSFDMKVTKHCENKMMACKPEVQPIGNIIVKLQHKYYNSSSAICMNYL